MPRAGLDVDGVLRAAAKIADSEGLGDLTVARLAESLGVKPPSLYNHIENLDKIKEALTTRGLLLVLDQTRDALAGVAGKDALGALGHSQRLFAREHPGLWAALQLPMASWNEASQKAADAYLALVLAVLRGYGLKGDAAIHAARTLRASLRGFIDLELGGGFGLPQDVEISFKTLLNLMDGALRVQERTASKSASRK